MAFLRRQVFGIDAQKSNLPQLALAAQLFLQTGLKKDNTRL